MVDFNESPDSFTDSGYSQNNHDYDHQFWTSNHRYEDLARIFDMNVERTHPGSVTSKGACPCLEYVSYCTWGATNVDYYEYRGPDVTNIT